MNKPLKAHIWERETNEHYVEPSWCSARLLEEEEFNGPIWDPCCGFGTIILNAMARGYGTYASDIIARRAGICDIIGDFLGLAYPGSGFDIICNPPFNIADRFALHALGSGASKVAMIFPTARLNAAHWLRGIPLRRVWLMTPRPSMPPGHVIAAGEKPGGGKMDFCWLIWERGYAGTPELRWLKRDTRHA